MGAGNFQNALASAPINTAMLAEYLAVTLPLPDTVWLRKSFRNFRKQLAQRTRTATTPFSAIGCVCPCWAHARLVGGFGVTMSVT